MQFYTSHFNFQRNCLHNWGTLSYQGACFQLPVDMTLHPAFATTVSHPFHLIITPKFGAPSWTFREEKRWYWLSARSVLLQHMFQDFPAKAQQLLLTSFQTVWPNTVMLKQNIFFVWVIPLWHKAIVEKLAENNTMGGKHTVNTSQIMFSMICCKVLWLMTGSLNKSVSLISTPSSHTESVSTREIYKDMKEIRHACARARAHTHTHNFLTAVTAADVLCVIKSNLYIEESMSICKRNWMISRRNLRK